jgi:hypothetical protein
MHLLIRAKSGGEVIAFMWKVSGYIRDGTKGTTGESYTSSILIELPEGHYGRGRT